MILKYTLKCFSVVGNTSNGRFIFSCVCVVFGEILGFFRFFSGRKYIYKCISVVGKTHERYFIFSIFLFIFLLYLNKI